jgi:hypothetical protein
LQLTFEHQRLITDNVEPAAAVCVLEKVNRTVYVQSSCVANDVSGLVKLPSALVEMGRVECRDEGQQNQSVEFESHFYFFSNTKLLIFLRDGGFITIYFSFIFLSNFHAFIFFYPFWLLFSSCRFPFEI